MLQQIHSFQRMLYGFSEIEHAQLPNKYQAVYHHPNYYRRIGWREPLKWPALLLDLTTLDYSWRYVKNILWKNPLSKWITLKIISVTTEKLSNVTRKFCSRLKYFQDVRCDHLENIFHSERWFFPWYWVWVRFSEFL